MLSSNMGADWRIYSDLGTESGFDEIAKSEAANESLFDVC